MVKRLPSTHAIPANIEAEVITKHASVHIVQLDWREQVELIVEPLDYFQIDLCLSARLQGMRVCFSERWSSERFERVGELMLIPPGERVVARCDFPEGEAHYLHSSTVLRLDPQLIYAWSGEPDWSPERLEAGLDIDDQSIYSLMGRLSREALASTHAPVTKASQRLVELAAEQVGIEVNRFFEGRNAFDFKGGLAAWRLRLIDERSQQIGKSPSVNELAELCRISPRQLQRGFRVSRGCSIGRYIEHCRIENAKRLLQRGEAISQVASRLGYASQSSFSYAFRRATGGTPAQYCQLI